jgi:hypothetical protein
MGDDRAALATLLSSTSRRDKQHRFRHYLYVPRETAAIEIGNELRRQGFEVSVELGAEGVDWLVLAQQMIVPSLKAIETARHLMEGLATTQGGEYDGWEAEVE